MNLHMRSYVRKILENGGLEFVGVIEIDKVGGKLQGEGQALWGHISPIQRLRRAQPSRIPRETDSLFEKLQLS